MQSCEVKKIEACYLEYRKACYNILYKHAEQKGVLKLLHNDGKTFEAISQDLAVLPKRKQALELFLRALVKIGAVAFDETTSRYKKKQDFTEGNLQLNREDIAVAIGNEQAEKLIHADSYRGIVDTFSQEENPVAADFINKNIALWDEFLQQPFYTFGRRLAAEKISKINGTVLDLACGPGFGLLELGELVGPQGQVVGVDFSNDFAQIALERVKQQPNIRVFQADIDGGLGFLRDEYFDGAAMIGAYHFLKRKDIFFGNVARVLKKGGRLCIGYAFMNRNTYDQEIMNLRMLLREPPAAPVDPEWLLNQADQAGLEFISDEGSIGSFGWYLFEKR